MVETTTAAMDYRNLPNCGGFAMDRPGTFKELMEAVKARVAVAEEVGSCAEYLSPCLNVFGGAKAKDFDRIVQEARWLVAFPVVGSNEGYYIHITAVKGGFHEDLAMVKVLGGREDVQRINHELNELFLRM